MHPLTYYMVYFFKYAQNKKQRKISMNEIRIYSSPELLSKVNLRIYVSSQSWCWAKKQVSKSLRQMQNSPQLHIASLYSQRWSLGKSWLNLRSRHPAQPPDKDAGCRCGRWQCGEENSSCQLQPAEEGEINKSKLPLNGKNRNETENTGHAELCWFFW